MIAKIPKHIADRRISIPVLVHDGVEFVGSKASEATRHRLVVVQSTRRCINPGNGNIMVILTLDGPRIVTMFRTRLFGFYGLASSPP